MFPRRLLLGLAIVVSMSALASADYGPRQYYSTWHKHPTRNYYYRSLYYKPTPKYVGFKHHYCIYSQQRPKHVYFYNPYQKTYWGRCGVEHGGLYSMLKPEHRKPTLEQIPVDHFPEPVEPPPLPEAEDGIRLDLPPDDLPLL